jgi:hypothetical protein
MNIMRSQANMTSIKMLCHDTHFSFLGSWNHKLYFFKACHDKIHVLKNKASFLDIVNKILWVIHHHHMYMFVYHVHCAHIHQGLHPRPHGDAPKSLITKSLQNFNNMNEKV